MTGVTSDALDHKLVVRYDPKLTTGSVLTAAIYKVVDGIDR